MADDAAVLWETRLDTHLGQYWDIFTVDGALVARILCDNSEAVANEIVEAHNARLEPTMPDTKWPCVHPMLKDDDGFWVWANDHVSPARYIPSDLADELNRLSTIDACARMIDAPPRHRQKEKSVALVMAAKYRNNDALLALHDILVQETTR